MLPIKHIHKKILFLLPFILLFILFTNSISVLAAGCNVANDPTKSPYKGTHLGIHPKLDEIRKAIEKDLDAAGLKYKWTQGFRTADYQNSLYAQGRTCPGSIVTKAAAGKSYHEYGLALDYTAVVGSGLSWETSVDTNGNGKGDYAEYGAIAQKHGVEWGGAWKSFVDVPHIQLTMGKTIAQLQKEGPPDAGADWTADSSSEETKVEEEQTGDIIGGVKSYKSIFKKYENTVANTGLKTKEKHENVYMTHKIDGTLGTIVSVLLLIAKIISILLIAYILVLSMIYLIAKTRFSPLESLLSKMTGGYITEETSYKQFFTYVGIALFFLTLASTGYLAKIFQFIYYLITVLINYLTYSL